MSTDAAEATAKEPEADNSPLAEQLAAATESPEIKADPDSSSDSPEDPTPFSAEGLRETAKRFGQDLSKYGDDDAALAALFNARDLASRRDTEADFGREIREALGGKSETEVRALLAGDTQPAQPAVPDDSFDPAEARARFLDRNEAGELVAKPGAPPGTVQQYLRHEEKRQVITDRLVTEPKALLREVFGDTIEEQVREQTGQQTAVQREEMAVERWGEEHAQVLHHNGDPNAGLTVLGQKVADFNASPRLLKIDQGRPVSLDRLETAMALAKASMPQSKTSTPSRQGKRRPDTAPALPDDSPRKEGEALAACLLRLHQARGSTVA